MAGKRVSIVDIARELKLSPSTVSRALRNEDRISAKTRRQVHALAESWGYRPNLQARSLINHRTCTIGLIVPDFVHPFFSTVLAGIESVLTPAGFQLMICTSNGLAEKEREATELLLNARVDGLLVSYAMETTHFGHFERLLSDGVPVVFIDRSIEDMDANYVVTDDFQGACTAVNHLADIGCNRIAHVKGPEQISTSFNRYLGYRETLKTRKLASSPEWVFASGGDSSFAFSEPERFLDLLPGLDGICVFNDYLAYEILRLIHTTRIRVPEDVAVIGFGNDPFGIFTHPSLSTIDQPARAMGIKSAEVLLDQILSEEAPATPQTHVLQTKLIVRGSTSRT